MWPKIIIGNTLFLFIIKIPRPIASQSSLSGQFLPSEDFSILSRVAVASIASQGTMGGLLVGGFVSQIVIKHIFIMQPSSY